MFVNAFALRSLLQEPDPRDDLNGLDVARKVVICARLAGLRISLADVDVENIVPAELRGVATADEFMRELPRFDGHFAALQEEAAASGTVLRYVGAVDVAAQKAEVKLKRFKIGGHPLSALAGSDNMIMFRSAYFPAGLVVQGAGAGADVTAFGIHADILAVRQVAEYA